MFRLEIPKYQIKSELSGPIDFTKVRFRHQVSTINHIQNL